ncbi:MAG TPA: hypothetical protein VII94_00330 [Candidatus Saccharimonadales bacterium]
MEHRIQYLRESYSHDHDGNVVAGKPVGCLAIKVSQRAGPRYLSYQHSVLNPRDQFNRELARQLALGRLVECPVFIRVTGTLTMKQITELVMLNIAQDKHAPGRARKAAKCWLKAAGTFD